MTHLRVGGVKRQEELRGRRVVWVDDGEVGTDGISRRQHEWTTNWTVDEKRPEAEAEDEACND